MTTTSAQSNYSRLPSVKDITVQKRSLSVKRKHLNEKTTNKASTSSGNKHAAENTTIRKTMASKKKHINNTWDTHSNNRNLGSARGVDDPKVTTAALGKV